MKEIQLTKGYVAIVDDEDYENLARHKWHITSRGYAARQGTNKCKYILMHREIMGVVEEERHVFVDHVDRNPLNNTRSNLRICSHAQNQWNKVKRDHVSSKYKGVHWDKQYKKWRAMFRLPNGKTLSLGRFDDEKEAAKVYNAMAIKYRGEFALLNDIG